MFEKGQQREITDLIENMLDGYIATQNSMREIDMIAEKSKLLAVNSARELGRMEMAGGFQIITQEIKVFANENLKANEKNKENVETLNDEISNMVGVRTADVACELIDKIDRNLFERYCDVQAWAVLAVVQAVAKNHTPELGRKATEVIQNLLRIYEVYNDIVIVDKDGKVIADAVNENAVGKDVSTEEWFQQAIVTEEAYVTDLHYSKFLQKYIVSYSARILDEEGNITGVLATHFNWDYILDMIDSTKISRKGEVYLINEKGQVIGARERELIFHKNMLLECQGAQTILSGDKKEDYGYALEMNEKQQLTRVLGYAKTKGYNKYRGKAWAVLALENIR